MNDDAAFDRVKMRRRRAALEDAGLSPARIAAAAAHLARARAALEVVTEAVLARAAVRTAGGFALDPAALTAAPREVGLRALAALLMAAGGRPIAPDSRRWSGCSTRWRPEPWAAASPCMAAASPRRRAGARDFRTPAL